MSHDLPEPEQLLTELRAAGAEDDAIATVLDKCFDWEVIVPGPAGAALEAVDGWAWARAVRWVRDLRRELREWYEDPERRERARQRRAERRAKRRARRGK